jgi:small subunit ribosomal protein S17e
MGRIKTTLVKRVSQDLMAQHSGRFTTSFDANKERVGELADVPSKKIRNIIAGYVTRLKQKEEAEAL